jgi:hypothetical protein
MAKGLRAFAFLGVGAVFLLGLIPGSGGQCDFPVVAGIVAGALWGVLVPVLEASIRGRLLAKRPMYGYLTVLALPPIMSLVVFLVMPAYARAFAFTAFGIWLLCTGVLVLATTQEGMISSR